MVAMSGVSDDQVMVVGMVTPPSRRLAKICAWYPTGSGTSPELRPENWISFGGGGGASLLHAPKLAVAGPIQLLVPGERCSDWPTAAGSSATPRSVDASPAAGPSSGVRTPSYDRNSVTTPSG